MNNKSKGRVGEELAVEFLKKKGIKIIETNWRYSRFGEIDIIVLDNNILAFVEVKTRTTENFGHPLEAINMKKILQIRSTAQAYIHENPELKVKGYRFDAVSVILSKEPKITYHKDIYQA
ncbi:MAG: YraN family protein [Candidatus Gastranaerophilaceae bacterium]|jgi:putative endonuclease